MSQSTGAVVAVATDTSKPSEPSAPSPAQQNINQANAFRPKNSPARTINPNTGNVEVVSGGQTKDQLQAEAQQQEIKTLGFTPGAEFPSQQEVNQKIQNLGIKYESQTGNLVNGVIESGGPSVRDQYVALAESEYAMGFRGTQPNPEAQLANVLGQVGFSVSKDSEGKLTITDPLVAGIVQQQTENAKRVGLPGGGFGESISSPIGDTSKAYGGLANFQPNESLNTKGLTKTQAQSIENGFLPSEQTVKTDNNPLTYSAEQTASLISAIKTNKEYGGDQNFLVGNIGTENSTGSLVALNKEQTRNTDQKTPIKPLTVEKSDISSLSNESLVNVGGTKVPDTLLFSPTQEAVDKANAVRESIATQREQENALANGLISLSNEQIAQRNQLIEQANLNAKANYAIDLLTFNSTRDKMIPLIGSGLDFQLPNEKTQLGVKIDFTNPKSLDLAIATQAVGLPISGIAETVNTAVVGTLGLLESLPSATHEIADIISKGKYDTKTLVQVGEKLANPFTPEATEFMQKSQVNPVTSPGLIGGVIAGIATGKGISALQSGYGPAYDITSLGMDALLTFVGSQKAIPIRYNSAVIEEGAGLAKGTNIPLGKFVTLGYQEGGSGVILGGRLANGKFVIGTPKPQDYLPENIPINLSGRGFTRAEAPGLLNKLVNSDQAIDYQVQQNIITEHDAQLIRAVRDATKLITKAPVTVFNPTFGEQPISTVQSGSETTALKEVITTGQSKLGLGSQYGSFADVPFVPGEVNVGDLDLAVSSTQQQKTVGTFAESMLNNATGNKVPLVESTSISKTPGSPLDLVIDNQLFGVNTMKVEEPERLFKFEEGGVFLYEKGKPGRTKIIDLPIKGLNEEGGALTNYHKVFGIKEPTEVYEIEGIDVLTPHYNTIRRSTTITRQGSKELKSALPGFGLTTKYGNYIGPEYGRLKDAARYYRGVILAANEYRKVGKIPEAEKLEYAANTVKHRFQHIFNFSEALREIRGEIVINKMPKSEAEKSLLSEQGSRLLLKEPLITQRQNKPVESISQKIKPEEKPSLSLTSRAREEPIIEKSISKSIMSKSIKESTIPFSKSFTKPSAKPSQGKNPSSKLNSILNPSRHSTFTPSNRPSLTPSSSPSGSPKGGGLLSNLLNGLPLLTPPPSKPFTKGGNTQDLINNGLENKPPKEILLPGLATKPDQRVIRTSKERFNYIGNSTESTLVGLYNRPETIYGKAKTAKLSHKDYLRTTKGFPKLVNTKTTGLVSTKKTFTGRKESKKKLRF